MDMIDKHAEDDVNNDGEERANDNKKEGRKRMPDHGEEDGRNKEEEPVAEAECKNFLSF